MSDDFDLDESEKAPIYAPSHWCHTCGQSLPRPKAENVDTLERRLTWLVRKQKEMEKTLAANLTEQEQVKRRIRKSIMKRMPQD